jgi:hypothetical protein
MKKKDFGICTIKVDGGAIYIEDGFFKVNRSQHFYRQTYFLKKEAEDIIQKIILSSEEAGLTISKKQFLVLPVKLNNIILTRFLLEIFSHVNALKFVSYKVKRSAQGKKREIIGVLLFLFNCYKKQHDLVFSSKSLKLEDIKNNINSPALMDIIF